MKLLLPAVASAALTVICLPLMRTITNSFCLMRRNFKGKMIPAGFGFLIVTASVPIYLVMAVTGSGGTRLALFLIAVIGFGVIGLMDDVYGTREVGGFHGHLGLLKQGRVSTGLIKAVVGGLLAFGLGSVQAHYTLSGMVLNGLLIGLSANLLNLLDLRPGRAVSFYWIGTILLVVSKLGKLPIWPELIPVMIPAVLLTFLDRSARVMLGDAGSNALGAVLGLSLVCGLGIPAKVVLVVLMIIVHLYAERYSISGLIEGNRVLRGFDRLLGER